MEADVGVHDFQGVFQSWEGSTRSGGFWEAVHSLDLRHVIDAIAGQHVPTEILYCDLRQLVVVAAHQHRMVMINDLKAA